MFPYSRKARVLLILIVQSIVVSHLGSAADNDFDCVQYYSVAYQAQPVLVFTL